MKLYVVNLIKNGVVQNLPIPLPHQILRILHQFIGILLSHVRTILMHFPLNEPPNIPRVYEHNEGDKKGIKSIHNRLLLYYAVALCNTLV